MSSSTKKDPSTAMVIEILAGYFGFLGMGYFYTGRTAAGLLRLFGWWAFLVMMILLIAIGPLSPLLTMGPAESFEESVLALNMLAGGFTLALIGLVCCLIPITLITPVVSGLMLKRSLEKEQ
jgi:mannitol-specific phosphotransferase system IIBC component